MTGEFEPGVICTASGVRFSLLDARIEDVRIEDIAHALAHQCRFGGHTVDHYSVAQHSVLVAREVPPEYALVGLLHDASEAYAVDLPAPIKQLMPEYQECERRIQDLLNQWAGIDPDHLAAAATHVHDADRLLLSWERRDLMPDCDWWPRLALGARRRINAWSPRFAARSFLTEYQTLAAIDGQRGRRRA